MNFSLLNIPLSDSSCKVFSMNLTAESHCCFSLTDQSSRAVSWITRWEVENRAVTNYTETDSRTVSNRHLLVFSFPISWPTKNQVRLEAEMSKLSRDDTLHVRLAEKFAKPKERCQNQSHKAIHQFWVKKKCSRLILCQNILLPYQAVNGFWLPYVTSFTLIRQFGFEFFKQMAVAIFIVLLLLQGKNKLHRHKTLQKSIWFFHVYFPKATF